LSEIALCFPPHRVLALDGRHYGSPIFRSTSSRSTFQRHQSALLIRAHQARITRHVGRKDGR
jgi:hypothetical protein